LKKYKSVYGWGLATFRRAGRIAALVLGSGVVATGMTGSALFSLPLSVQAQVNNAMVMEARTAFSKRDLGKLAQLRAQAAAERNPLAPWFDYWELNPRLGSVSVDEVEAFYARWPGTYVEDRLRNDWLLELGRRRDWKNLAADYPRFRMNDDREVACYALLADHLNGKDVAAPGKSAWYAQKDADDGCALLAATLFATKQLPAAEVWRRARVAIDGNKPRAAQQAVALVSPSNSTDASELTGDAARYLRTKASTNGRTAQELATLALMRLASTDPDATASQLRARWDSALPPELAAWAWAAVGKQAAMKLLPDAPAHYQRAAAFSAQAQTDIDWSDETLAWKTRAALRSDGAPRWQQVMQAINAMHPNEQRDPTWVFWKARALKAMAKDSSDPAGMRAQADEMMGSIALQLSFYGALASEELGRPITVPTKPLPVTSEERDAAMREPGLLRALMLINVGLRGEAAREWNFTLRGMNDRQLLAAAQIACDRELWDRCINTSDRTQVQIDMNQRYPTPFKRELRPKLRDVGVDMAYVYGLIRQESRFVVDARSGVGASGLMQVMPATARWTAKKIGLPFSPHMITDRDTNLTIGANYLKLVLDDLGGSQAMAAAAYNAGPGRPRRWREGPILEPAIWVENVPFSETRDYVKKVMSNAIFYSAVLNETAQAPSLKARLGRTIGPRDGGAPPPDGELP
jgi:soluble lytic murein transglycosylase